MPNKLISVCSTSSYIYCVKQVSQGSYKLSSLKSQIRNLPTHDGHFTSCTIHVQTTEIWPKMLNVPWVSESVTYILLQKSWASKNEKKCIYFSVYNITCHKYDRPEHYSQIKLHFWTIFVQDKWRKNTCWIILIFSGAPTLLMSKHVCPSVWPNGKLVKLSSCLRTVSVCTNC